MRIFKGDVVSCDENANVYKYLVEDKGRIVFLGNSLPDKYKSADITDLKGKALLPSFGDTHTHFLSYSLFASTLDVREALNFDDLKRIICDYAGKSREKVIIGFGISPSSLEEKRLPKAEELDAMYSDRPLLIVKYDGHASVANSKMLKMLPNKIKKLRGFSSDGNLLHESFYASTDYVTGKISPIALIKAMQKNIDHMAEKGVSIIHTAESVGFPLDLDVDIVRMMAKAQSNPMQFRLFFQTMDLKKVIKRKLPRIGGCFATALDGCFGSMDAALLKPYSNSESHGILFYKDEEVREFVKNANRKDLQVQLHAIGDRAFKQAVDAISSALKDYPRGDHRHSIIHACLTDKLSLEKCAELGICIAAQPSFLNWNLEPFDFLESVIGKRTFEISPYRTMLDMKIHVSGGSDAPCTLVSPIEGIFSACNHYVKEESVSINEALRMFTYEAAFLGFDEKERGSLEISKYADMVILNKNPLKMKKEELSDLEVEGLFLKGKPYRKGNSFFKGFFSYLKNRNIRV